MFLHRDFDDDAALQATCQPHSAKAKRRRTEVLLPLGPQTHAEADAWVQSSMIGLRDRGMQEFGVDFSVSLQASLEPGRGLCLRTDYSGMGGPEEALHQMEMALSLDSSALVCQQGDDLDTDALTMWRYRIFRWSACSECCLHGNILERCPQVAFQKMNALHGRYFEVG